MLLFGKHRDRKGARAGLLTGAVVAALGISALSAGTAAAAPGCSGSSIEGQGSSLQKEAQLNIWNPGFAALCPSGPTVSYLSSGSGKGLGAWGMTAAGGKVNTADAFVSSDDGPSPTQIKYGEEASGGSKVLIIPVAQTAITAVVNPPANCEIEEITDKQLESIFRGTITKWGKIETAYGEGCAGAAITRVVRAEGSGTSYQFKNFLSLINSAPVACTEGNKTWKELETIGPVEEKPNTEWPKNGVNGCGANQVSAITTGAGGSGVVKKVNITNGSIGYAALPDIESNKGATGEFENPEGDTAPLALENNGNVKLENATFAQPNAGSATANCANAAYKVPFQGRPGYGPGEGEGVDWSQVFGAKLNAGGENFPLCTITYTVALKNYAKAGFSEGAEITAHDYLTEYVTATAGQSALKTGKKWYAPLPGLTGTPPAANNVLAAAQLSASLIGL